MRFSELERAALAASFRVTDPDAPTLCEGWNARFLLAHLVQREHAPLDQLLDARAKAAPGREPKLAALAATADTTAGYHALIERFAAGTGALNPMSWLGDAGALLEYVVHHEDLLRGAGAASPAQQPAPERSAAQLEKLFRQLSLLSRLVFRSSPVGVSLVREDGRAALAKRGGGVMLSGDPVELALFLNGRRTAARVQRDGTPQALASFDAWLNRKG